jgi:hypothetical protein
MAAALFVEEDLCVLLPVVLDEREGQLKIGGFQSLGLLRFSCSGIKEEKK